MDHPTGSIGEWKPWAATAASLLGAAVIGGGLYRSKGGRVREIVEGRGCEVLYLPPYSPDLDPSEQTFSKVKG